MKKTVVLFVVAILVLLSLFFWVRNADMTWNLQEILNIFVVLILVGFAVMLGLKRIQSSVRKEPAEDEFSKMIMVKSSSLSYYLSIYLWLALMYFSDRIKLENHTLIGAGILGMAVIFLLSWIGVKYFRFYNE